MTASQTLKPGAEFRTRVAVLVDAATGWGREVISGIHRFSQKHGDWQLFIESDEVVAKRGLSGDWRGDGVIARVSQINLARCLRALRIPVVKRFGH